VSFVNGLAASIAALFSIPAMQHIVTLREATISPDASRIAFVASRADLNRNRYDDTLEIYDMKSRRLRSISVRHDSVGAIAWSPNALRLAAVMDVPTTHRSQLFLIDPVTGSERRLTDGATSVGSIAWRPDGARIAFIREENVRPKHGAAAYEDGFEVTDNPYLATKAAQPSHVWLVDMHGHEQRLTGGAESDDGPLSWSPDGTSLVFDRGPAVYGERDLARVVRLDLASQRVADATPHSQYEGPAEVSPDGRQVVYLYGHDGSPVNQSEAWVVDTSGSGDRDASAVLDRSVSSAAWMPNSRALLLQVNDNASASLVMQPLNGRARKLPLGRVVAARIDTQGSIARNGSIVFIGSESAHPDELYILHRGAGAPERLTSFNESIARLQLGKRMRVTWRSADGFTEDGVLTYPAGYVSGRTYALVLHIHGGPYETSTLAFSSFDELAAARGYLVFAPNYRGSTDRGNAYVRAIYNDPSRGPGRDIMAGVAAVVRMGIVDRSRVGVSGWSYGGQLTSWLEGRYHVWKAAVAGAAVNDLIVDYATADDIDDDRLIFDIPSPFTGNAIARWRDQSPISYAGQIRTPTLILCNVYDVRVPIVESYEMYHALRDNGVPVRFIAYPTTGHLPNGPVRLADVYTRWLNWFDVYLK
jgi:dipeptidyl aminopeptidase/acylaminoacyl peptidase